jgi:hypothetical protein
VLQQSPFSETAEDEFGLGDIAESILIAPQDTKQLWAIGPAFFLPTAQEKTLGARKWAVGPNAIGLVHEGPWIVGAIGSQLWSFAGDEERRNVNLTTISPFLAYTTAKAFTFQLEADVIYNWDSRTSEDALTLPITLSIAHVRRLGRHLVNVGVGGRYYVDAPEGGPEWGVRFFVTYLFQK